MYKTPIHRRIIDSFLIFLGTIAIGVVIIIILFILFAIGYQVFAILNPTWEAILLFVFVAWCFGASIKYLSDGD